MSKFSLILIALALIVSLSNGDVAQQTKEIIDLGWPLENKTLHWPTAPGFEQRTYHDGPAYSDQRNGTYYYKSDGFFMGTHVGTHMDAPAHFSSTSWTVDLIDLQRMVNVPFVIFDVSKLVEADRTYCFKKSDFIKGDKQESFAGKVVIVYTGMSSKYSQGIEAYIGTNSSDYTKMRIPGFSKEAAEFITEKGAYGVGLDSVSADCSMRHDSSTSMNPVAHDAFNSKNVFILENLNNRVKDLVGKQVGNYRLTLIPLQMTKFSGSPVRPIVTSVEGWFNCTECIGKNSASTINLSNHYLTATLFLIITVFSRALNMSF